jgi:ATP-binding cassette, subfamily B, multidrug efflux pump
METAVNIQKALNEVMKGRTTFIIAHRISSLKHADEILVLEDGRIVERGKHEELIENNGIYQRIYDIQFKDQKTELTSNIS